ncbi:hypothetical protein U1Q18_040492, partial [Sarracenia purpurea var. burkii]
NGLLSVFCLSLRKALMVDLMDLRSMRIPILLNMNTRLWSFDGVSIISLVREA